MANEENTPKEVKQHNKTAGTLFVLRKDGVWKQTTKRELNLLIAGGSLTAGDKVVTAKNVKELKTTTKTELV